MKSYSLEIPENMLELAQIKSRADETNMATALQQLLYAGAERCALELIANGRLAVGRGAELLGVSVHDVQRLAQEHGVELGATVEQYARAREVARNLE